MSVLDNRSIASTDIVNLADYKEIKQKFKKITDISKLKEFVAEYNETISNIPINILNTWITLENYKLYRRKGTTYIIKKDETKATTMTALRSRVELLETQINVVIENINKIDNKCVVIGGVLDSIMNK